MTTSSIPAKCWLYRNRKYHLRGEFIPGFPSFRKEDCDVLEENGIPFREVDAELVEIWKPDVYEEKAITLPAYVKVFDSYRYLGNHTEMIPTLKTAEEAFEYARKKVDSLIEEKRLKELLAGKPLVVISSYHPAAKATKVKGVIVRPVMFRKQFMRSPDYFFDLFDCMGEAHEETCFFASDYCVVFDTNKIEKGSCLTLEVPKGKEGIFIGTKGWQVKEWCRLFGMWRINVVGV